MVDNTNIELGFYCHTVTLVNPALVVASKQCRGRGFLTAVATEGNTNDSETEKDSMVDDMRHYIFGLLLSSYCPYRGTASPCFIRILVAYLRQF